MESTNQNTGPVTRKRRACDNQMIKNKELMQKWLQPVVVIGPNEIVTNLHLGKVKVEHEEWEVKPEVIVQVNEQRDEPLVVHEQVIDAQEGILVVKEEEDDEIQNGEKDVELSMNCKNVEKILEENGLLKTEMEERDTRIAELERIHQEKKIKHKEVLTKVQRALKQTDSSHHEKINTLQNIMADLDVEIDEEDNVQNVERRMIPNLPGESSAVPEVAKVLALFPEVIQLIWNKYKYSLISRTDFLTLRLVSSVWKEAVYELGAGPCKALQTELTIFYDKKISWKYGKFDAKKGRCKNHSPSNSQPFSVSVVYSDPHKVSQGETTKLSKLLEEVGHSIRELTFYNENNTYDMKFFERRFTDCLKFMANLTKVQIKNYDRPGAWYDQGVPCPMHTIDGYKRLLDFPTLPKLKHFSKYEWPFDLLRAAVAKNPQLVGLKMFSTRDVENLIPHNCCFR